ncbi:FCS-Like Zinc finger 1-like [Hordeum vulgare subsp. vulgare]|uniref:Predicted protein n=1 Tax=Hordeum vulgare subsp. vulgare TaxID=112509 RepID=F2D1L7_HORVV|nr:FCS-Like Zinc finger 1-like [Hordeum vulgare subsp. vulgare]KAI5010911.1 hypothetical protein ZWY2020_013048 [Hordeum vulgare]KAI5010928.1 hypothetical protein ZWY2020_013065 [Hordeum vulgare]BAJ88988.1 predicted protein [Hordeum vulgare subsp. vulgare]BAJ96210.1 predicted protein [Hordeum vulgare subsp. vulgare]
MACAFFFDAEPLGEPGVRMHGPELELHACALCTKPLQSNSDIFMYKGDTPFCSEDCRYEQMHFDAAMARQQASARRKQQQQQQAQAPLGVPGAPAPVSAKADVSVAS